MKANFLFWPLERLGIKLKYSTFSLKHKGWKYFSLKRLFFFFFFFMLVGGGGGGRGRAVLKTHENKGSSKLIIL